MRRRMYGYNGSARVAGAFLAVSLLVTLVQTPAQAVTPTSSPGLYAPGAGTSVSANPVLRWHRVAGAIKYRVQVSKSSTFSSLLYSADTFNSMATVPTDLPVGTIYWRVAGTDGGSGVGPFAESSFQRTWNDTPNLLAPADGAALAFPDQAALFRWAPLAGATSYRIEVDDADDFIQPAVSVVTSHTEYSLLEPQTIGQNFYWRVQGLTGSGSSLVTSDWSTARRYSVSWPASAPVLTSPPNEAVLPTSPDVTDIVLDWEPVEGAATYHVQISPNGDWANNVADQNLNVHGTRYSPPVTLDNGHYYWRVRAKDAKGTAPNEGAWSQEWQFTRAWPGRPTLLTPANGDTQVVTPTFSWTPVENASHYELQVGTDENFSPTTYTTCFTNHTQFTPHLRPVGPNNLPGGCDVKPQIGQLYYWRVRGQDHRMGKSPINGLWSNTSASDTFTFIHRAAEIPDLVAPADGATVDVPTLQWDPVEGQGKYIVYIKPAGGTPAPHPTYATSFTPTSLNPADGPFKWFVITENGVSGKGLTPHESTWRTFSLTAPTSTTNLPEIQSPANGAAEPRMPLMRWSHVEGATYYKVSRSQGGSVATVMATNLKFPAYTHPGMTLPSGTYTWYVDAYDATGWLATSGHSTFVVAPLGAPTYTGPPKCTASDACLIADTPTMEWEPVTNAGSYRVYIAADPNFTNILREFNTVFTTLTPRESLVDSQAGQSFYWFVRPCIDPNLAAGSPCGPFNESVFPQAFAFRKRSAAVELQHPADGAPVGDDVTFSWKDFLATNLGPPKLGTQEARQYRIQVSTVSDFASILDERVVDQLTYTPFDRTYPDGPLFWRVQAIDGSNNNLTMSAPRSLTKSSGAVAPLAPAPGTTVRGIPTFRWEPRAFAAKYELEVYKNGDTLFSPTNKVAAASKITKLTAWAPTAPLPAGQYAWRIRKRDVDDRPGVWASGGTLTLLPTEVPQLLEPAHNKSLNNHDLLFRWSVTNAAVRYRVETSQSSTFSSIYDSASTTMPAWAPIKLYADGTYYWRVHILDSANNVLATSGKRTFVKQEGMATALSITASTGTVSEPANVRLTGILKRRDTGAVLAGRSVQLLGRKATSSTFSRLATAVTNRRGEILFEHSPRRHWVYKLWFPTNGAVIGAASATKTVRYKPRLAAELVASTINKGGRTRVAGTISPYFRYRKIHLQKLVGRRWTTVASKTLGAPANTTPRVTKFSFRVSPKRGTHYYRVKFPAKSNVNLGAVSVKDTLRVY